MRVFFDSSAFAKRYVQETGSSRVMTICSQAQSIGLSALAFPEICSALRRLNREGRISDDEYRRLKSAILKDIGQSDLCDLTPQILQTAVDCLERYTLRTLDAIQLGSALVYGTDLFVSADHRQL